MGQLAGRRLATGNQLFQSARSSAVKVTRYLSMAVVLFLRCRRLIVKK